MRLSVTNQWNGTPSPRPDVQAVVSFEETGDGIRVTATSPRRDDERVPDAPSGSRVANLWEYDAVELFLAGPDHRYLELELGPGGHFLLLGFDGIRKRSNEHEGFDPIVSFQKDDVSWTVICFIPSLMLPTPLKAVNAFVIASGLHLAAYPVPGEKPDFHQPDAFQPIGE